MELVVGASSGAVKSLVSKLGSLLAQEYTLISGVGDDIQYINDELSSMQAFLDRLRRPEVIHDEQRKDWMKQVREVAYDIEDCVDNVSHRLGGEPRGSGKLVYLRRVWYFFTTLCARRCIAADIGNLKARAHHVSERRTRYGVENIPDPLLTGGGAVSNPAGANAPRDRLPPHRRLIGTTEPVGMDEAINEIKAMKPSFLHGDEIPNTVNTVDGQAKAVVHEPRYLAIVGFGGLGKTTLAMALYRKFGDEFDRKAFVLASQKFHLKMVLRSLVKQFHEQQSDASQDALNGIEEWGDERLKTKLADQLRDKRYYVLIDDIWSVSAWENIRDSLPTKEKGASASIMVTTRFNSVAEACRRQKGHVHKLKQLSPESSCDLFLQIIHSNDIPRTRPIDAQIIMKTCGGLPLAIVVVAGLIASKLKSSTDSSKPKSSSDSSKPKSSSDSSKPKSSSDSSKPKSSTDSSKPKSSTDSSLDDHLVEAGKALSAELGSNLTTEGVSQIINHCYKNLPAELKTCFLYLSTFPKGRSISRKRLIRRWIAEGFITENHGKTVEEVAEDSFNELIDRNLILPINNSSSGKVKCCQIHDMVLEYIVSKSSDENFITIIGGHWQTPFPSYKVRRLSIHRSERQETEIVERMKLSHVRSLTVLESSKALRSTMLKFQILHVLDLEGCKDLSLSQLKKICKMHQLKYLSLRSTEIDKMPSKIGRLEYLEVLDIRDTNVRKLPPSVERLQRMTHLLAGKKTKRIALRLTEGITKMTSIQNLSGIEIYGRSTNDKAPDMPVVRASAPTDDAHNGGLQVNRKEASKLDVPKQARPLAALEKLTNLKKFTIYRLVKFHKKDNELLLSAIEHLSSCSLKFLAIDDSFTGFLDSSLSSSQAPPEHLYTLQLSGMLSQVPSWIDRMHNLEKLTLSLTSLTTETLETLSKLPELFSLIFSLDAANNVSYVLKIVHKNTLESGGKIFIQHGGFEKLKLLRFEAPVLPPLSFLEGAMPKLERLELSFRMPESVYGLENLDRLKHVNLRVSSQASKDPMVKVKISHIKGQASLIQKANNSPNPSVVIDEDNFSFVPFLPLTRSSSSKWWATAGKTTRQLEDELRF
ncbi:hypothetical protein GUJ93_ZPchr0011g27907 [Zizania palustris]|uniref:Uncharacterized protein n=1 Tax=Zizania palustris TaxID=103762 RepID=A0A8J6BR18_ZIZPA|nr:hypothetical protein GUJ93_ZPchr0011g27907 [Zizania palustris]